MNGFELVGEDAEEQALVFRCTHYDRATRSCDSYDSRPGMCRDYPRLLLWQPRPQLLPGCGYRVRPPNAAGFRESLCPPRSHARATPEALEGTRARGGLGLAADGKR